MSTMAERYEQAASYLVAWFQLQAPKRTGNLAKNGIRRAFNPVTGFWQIVIGGEPAPYVVYTNEPWISPKWHGKKNPNEGWIQKAIDSAIPTLKAILGGMITFEDLNKQIFAINGQVTDQFMALAAKA